MTALQIVERDIIIATLQGSTELSDIVGDRILWEYVSRKGKVIYPYVRILLKYGGYSNVAQSLDSKSTWQVTGICMDDLVVAENMLNAIHDTLHNKFPTVPENYTQVNTTYTLLEEQSIFRAFKYHNEPLYDVGGLYCLRLSLDEDID